MKKELSTGAFWGIIGAVALVVVGAIWLFANPNTGERAPTGAPPPAPQGSSSAAPPPPPPGGFPKG